MAKYGVVNTDNLLGTQFGEHIESLIDVDNDIENASIGYVGNQIEGERETREFGVYDATTLTTKRAVLVCQPAEIYYAPTPSAYNDDQFINKAGKPFRAYSLAEGDEFSISDYSITALNTTTGPVVGNFATVVAGSTKIVETATEPTTGTFYGEIIDIGSFPANYQMGFTNLPEAPFKWVSIRVVKNSV